MPVETPSVFAHVIQEHLELKRRNSDLDENMPIERYSTDDPFENHPLFKTEEQARIEETMDGTESRPSTWRASLLSRSRPQTKTRSGVVRATSTGATEPHVTRFHAGRVG
jgi:hypothetical protein